MSMTYMTVIAGINEKTEVVKEAKMIAMDELNDYEFGHHPSSV